MARPVSLSFYTRPQKEMIYDASDVAERSPQPKHKSQVVSMTVGGLFVTKLESPRRSLSASPLCNSAFTTGHR